MFEDLEHGKKYVTRGKYEFELSEDGRLNFTVYNHGTFTFNPLGYMMDMYVFEKLLQKHGLPVQELPSPDTSLEIGKKDLEELLREAIEAEDYMKAADIRDTLNRLYGNGEL